MSPEPPLDAVSCRKCPLQPSCCHVQPRTHRPRDPPGLWALTRGAQDAQREGVARTAGTWRGCAWGGQGDSAAATGAPALGRPPPGRGGRSRAPPGRRDHADAVPLAVSGLCAVTLLFLITWKYASRGDFLEGGAELVRGQTPRGPGSAPEGHPHPPRISRARGPPSTCPNTVVASEHPRGYFLLHIWVT